MATNENSDGWARPRGDGASRVPRRARAPRRRPDPPPSDHVKRSLTDTAADVCKRAVEAGDYVKTLIEIQQDRAGLAIRRKTTQLALAAIGACAGLALVLTATLLVVHGVADGLTVWFGGRAWLGNLVGGLLLLGLASAAIAASIWRRNQSQLSKQVKKYERLRNEHRARHGRHVADSAPTAHGGSASGRGGEAGARRAAPQFE